VGVHTEVDTPRRPGALWRPGGGNSVRLHARQSVRPVVVVDGGGRSLAPRHWRPASVQASRDGRTRTTTDRRGWRLERRPIWSVSHVGPAFQGLSVHACGFDLPGVWPLHGCVLHHHGRRAWSLCCLAKPKYTWYVPWGTNTMRMKKIKLACIVAGCLCYCWQK
jgi:hypothetical protein